jgi:hypothetical protein
MTRAQAGELLALLSADYPRTTIDDATIGLWLDELGRLDHKIGTTAVQSLVASQKFWPSIAHLHEQVEIARQQAARERVAAERRAANLALDLTPRLPLAEIPAAVELLERFTEPLPLERGEDGDCDDGCGSTGARYQLGRVRVCADCGRRRLRAARITSDADATVGRKEHP